MRDLKVFIGIIIAIALVVGVVFIIQDQGSEQNQHALRAATEKIGVVAKSQILVGVVGIGPTASVLSGQRSATELHTRF